MYSANPKTICNALKNGNKIQTNGAKGELMNNDPLLCQHDNSHVWEFADRNWLKQWKSAGASNYGLMNHEEWIKHFAKKL